MKKFGYTVKIEQRCENEIESDEEFGSWERYYENWFESISKAKDVPDVVSDFDIQKGETCYVVWVEYNSGNSFGTAENENVEVVGVFRDKKCAKELEKAIVDLNRKCQLGEFDNCENWDDTYKFYFKTSDGQEFKYGHCPWYGYFESLSNVYVEEAVME